MSIENFAVLLRGLANLHLGVPSVMLSLGTTLRVSMTPKIALQGPISITARLTAELAKGGRTDREAPPLLLDVDTRPGAARRDAGLRGLRARAAATGEAVMIDLFQAVDRLASGRGVSAQEAISEVCAQNRRIECLIETCIAQARADAALSKFPKTLPTMPLEGLIARLESVPLPRPPAVGLLLRTARRTLAIRSKRGARIARMLELIFNEARADRLELWGATSPGPLSEVEVVPRAFLQRNIAIDTSLRHIGLVHYAERPTYQRAIIAPTGRRSAAYFNVRLARNQFFAVFAAELETSVASTTAQARDANIRCWFEEVHLPAWKTRNQIPTQTQSLKEARQANLGLHFSRAIIRALRRELAPPSWSRPGPRPRSRQE